MDRIHQLTVAQSQPPRRPAPELPPEPSREPPRDPSRTQPAATSGKADGWVPIEPDSLTAAGLTDGEVEALIPQNAQRPRRSDGPLPVRSLKLPFRIIDPLLHSMKHDRLVAHKGAAPMNDYVYQLTELGRERAKKFAEHCTYFGSAAGAARRVHRQRQAANARRSASRPKRICTARSKTC